MGGCDDLFGPCSIVLGIIGLCVYVVWAPILVSKTKDQLKNEDACRADEFWWYNVWTLISIAIFTGYFLVLGLMMLIQHILKKSVEGTNACGCCRSAVNCVCGLGMTVILCAPCVAIGTELGFFIYGIVLWHSLDDNISDYNSAAAVYALAQPDTTSCKDFFENDRPGWDETKGFLAIYKVGNIFHSMLFLFAIMITVVMCCRRKELMESVTNIDTHKSVQRPHDHFGVESSKHGIHAVC